MYDYSFYRRYSILLQSQAVFEQAFPQRLLWVSYDSASYAQCRIPHYAILSIGRHHEL
jgi:hypothetical protein